MIPVEPFSLLISKDQSVGVPNSGIHPNGESHSSYGNVPKKKNQRPPVFSLSIPAAPSAFITRAAFRARRSERSELYPADFLRDPAAVSTEGGT